MTNFEKYKDKILKIIKTSRSGIAGIKDEILFPCNMINCSECSLNRDGSNCIYEFIKWLYEDDGEEHDGCDGCKHEHKREDESPCTECAMNYTSKWEHRPKKTRQDEFLEMFPEAIISKLTNASVICPMDVSKNVACRGRSDKNCHKCKKDYWLQEVEC